MSQKKQNYEFNKQAPATPPAAKKVETDEILTGSDKFMYQLGQHWKKIAIGIGVIVVVVIALIVIKFVREHNDLKLRQEFAAAKTVQELQALVDKHPDHPSAIPALFRLGDLYAATNDNAKAAESFIRICDAKKNVNDFDRLRAALAAAYQLEASGKDTEAIARFTMAFQDQAVQEYPMILQEAVYGAARLHFKNKQTKEAQELLEKVAIPENGLTYWQRQCQKLKDQLAAK